MAAPVGPDTIKFNSNIFNNLRLLLNPYEKSISRNLKH